MKKHLKSESNLNDHSVQILFLVGFITLFLLIFWIYILWNEAGNLPWYTDLLSGSTTSFFIAFVIMIFQNRFQQRLYDRDAFFKSLIKHGIKDMHHNKKNVLSAWIKNAKKEVCMTGYRLIITLEIIDDLIYALNNSKDLTVKILTCPPWSNTYKKIFNDDSSTNYIFILKKLKDKIPNFNNRIFFRFTDKPLFNDTYIIDDRIITSPYMHNRIMEDKTHDVITADKFFSLEISNDSNLFYFFKEDFMSVWEHNETKYLNVDFELFNSKAIEERLVSTHENNIELYKK